MEKHKKGFLWLCKLYFARFFPRFKGKFKPDEILGSQKKRIRKFDPKTLFLSVLHLAAGKNSEGYLHSLWLTWELGVNQSEMASKGSLSKARARISYSFFEDIHKKQIILFDPHRKTWNGLYVYGVDGDQYELPASNDILEMGYRGYPLKDKETYYPRMYACHAYDVLSGVSKDFRQSKVNQEIKMAHEMVSNFESNSLTLYDRLYSLSHEIIQMHTGKGSFFISRCKKGFGFAAINDFIESNRTHDELIAGDITIHLVKIKNTKTGKYSIFATNLPKHLWVRQDIKWLYGLRWEIETSFRDWTCTMKAEQWHSKSLNGILQEIFCCLWLMNFAKINISLLNINTLEPRSKEYKKTNFKLILDYLIRNLKWVLKGAWDKLTKGILRLSRASIEKRKRYRKMVPRQTKYSRKNHASASIIRSRSLSKKTKKKKKNLKKMNLNRVPKKLSKMEQLNDKRDYIFGLLKMDLNLKQVGTILKCKQETLNYWFENHALGSGIDKLT